MSVLGIDGLARRDDRGINLGQWDRRLLRLRRTFDDRSDAVGAKTIAAL